MILCITSLGLPVSAIANTDNTTAISDTQESHILFSKLFFNNLDDIEKLTEYFNDDTTIKNNIQSIETIDIDSIISELGLNTNSEETICILKNILEINEYVEEEKITDATEGCNPFDNIGGLFSEEPISNGVVQPLWGAGVHRDDTTTYAKAYFSAPVAEKIGKYNKEVDTKYSSGWGAITGSANQYIHFNEYASGSDDSRDYAAAVWFMASSLSWKNGDKENAYMYLGYALHPLQDKEAHGQIDRGAKTPHHLWSVNGDNRNKADVATGWEWTNSSRNALKAVSGSKKRLNVAVAVTKQYLSEYSKILK